jgi:integrase
MRRPKTRANGEGSIYQDGDDWIAQISIRGLPVRRRCKTKAAALVKLDELRERRRRHLNLTDRAPAFSVWFEAWLTNNRRLKASTREDYRAQAGRYTLPTLGRILVSEITAPMLQDWINALDDRGLAPNTIRNAYARVRSALGRAVRDRLIDYNPAIGLDLPSGRKRQPIALTEDESRALLAAVASHRLAALYILALALGLRQGELLALKWSDVSWKAATVTIRRTLRRTGKKTREGSTKTEAGERVLELSDDLMSVLRQHWQNQDEERVIFDRRQEALPAAERRRWNPDRRVFCNEAGREIAARNLLRHFDKVKAAAKLPEGLVFHDLRHTAGSLMLARGADILDVSKILGHSSPAVTMRIYAHSYKNKRRAATADLARALLRRAE